MFAFQKLLHAIKQRRRIVLFRANQSPFPCGKVLPVARCDDAWIMKRSRFAAFSS